jgi:hypothetical protein
MSEDLVLTAPLIWNAVFSTITNIGLAQNPVIPVFPYEIGQYEPGTYVIVKDIENLKVAPETLGYFSMIESYDITGYVSVFTGSSPSEFDTSPATSTLTNCFNAFYTMVMTPMMSNRSMPMFGVLPTPNNFYLNEFTYTAGPGSIAGGAAGWEGTLEWSFHYEAFITPA